MHADSELLVSSTGKEFIVTQYTFKVGDPFPIFNLSKGKYMCRHEATYPVISPYQTGTLDSVYIHPANTYNRECHALQLCMYFIQYTRLVVVGCTYCMNTT